MLKLYAAFSGTKHVLFLVATFHRLNLKWNSDTEVTENDSSDVIFQAFKFKDEGASVLDASSLNFKIYRLLLTRLRAGAETGAIRSP